MKRILILFSGGLDSYILYHMALQEKGAIVEAIYWDHGHTAAKSEMARLPKFVKVRKVDWLNKVEGLFSKEGDPSGPIYIPGRNLVFIVLSACEELPDEIWIGALLEENHDGGTDKNNIFLQKTTELLKYTLSPFKEDIKVRAPFVERGLTKYKAVKWALENGLTINNIIKTISCYQQENAENLEPCGNCKQCLRRFAIFYDLGFNEQYLEHPLDSVKNRKWIDEMINIGLNKQWPSYILNDLHWVGILKYIDDNLDKYKNDDWIKKLRIKIKVNIPIDKMI